MYMKATATRTRPEVFFRIEHSSLQLYEKTPAQLFSYDFCEILKNTNFIEHLRATASATWN